MPKLSKMKDKIIKLEKQVKKYRRLFVAALVLWVLFYLSGFVTGWWVVKGTLGSFPAVDAKTRLLVIAPHPDDETIMAGGLIQRVLAKDGRVRIIFLTSGDGSRGTVVQDTRKVDLNPAEFIALGEQRIQEAFKAVEILGIKRSETFFLGFPDQGLTKMGASATTKVSYVPYPEAYQPSQVYSSANLLIDVGEIAKNFFPTVVITGHPRDQHPDHRVAYALIEKIRSSLPADCKIYSSLVHYKGYPNPGGYLFPPKKLFGGDWLSLDLSASEQTKNRQAIEVHVSQYSRPQDKLLLNRFTSRNEIFEAE